LTDPTGWAPESDFGDGGREDDARLQDLFDSCVNPPCRGYDSDTNTCWAVIVVKSNSSLNGIGVGGPGMWYWEGGPAGGGIRSDDARRDREFLDAVRAKMETDYQIWEARGMAAYKAAEERKAWMKALAPALALSQLLDTTTEKVRQYGSMVNPYIRAFDVVLAAIEIEVHGPNDPVAKAQMMGELLLDQLCLGPALKGSPYHPDSVEARIRPQYRSNPAHDPHSPHFNPKKTPEPADAASVYQNASRADMGTWYGRGKDGWYRYFSDNVGGAHFSGIVEESKVPISIRRDW
jgi:hypothetical protein